MPARGQGAVGGSHCMLVTGIIKRLVCEPSVSFTIEKEMYVSSVLFNSAACMLIDALHALRTYSLCQLCMYHAAIVTYL